MPRDYTIVLSAYEGAPYLDAQLESLQAQTAPGWRLLVRDDGSSDDTHLRLVAWAAREPRIELLPRDGRNLGPAASFGVLLQHALDAGARHVFLCDQDDVWLPEKCERMLEAMREREQSLGEEMPVLVHCDLEVVGPGLATIDPSFVALQRMEPQGEQAARRLLLRNAVTGCAALVNAPLLLRALPMPDVAMHDWWLAQCAAAFGEVRFLPAPLVRYRQHGRNAVGAHGLLGRAGRSLRSPASWWTDSARRFLAGLRQVWMIRARAHQGNMRPGVGEAVEALWDGIGVDGSSWRTRLAAARRSGAMPGEALMRALFLTRLALLPVLRSRHGDERAGIAGR